MKKTRTPQLATASATAMGNRDMRHQARVTSRDSPQHHEAIKEACQEGSKCDLVAAVPHEVCQHARTELPRGERHVVIAIAGKNQ